MKHKVLSGLSWLVLGVAVFAQTPLNPLATDSTNRINRSFRVTDDRSITIEPGSSFIVAEGATASIPAGSFTVAQGKTLYVDFVNGNDATGIRGQINKPYLTIAEALGDALSGDLVLVGPGTWTITTSGGRPSVPAGVTLAGAGRDRTTISIGDLAIGNTTVPLVTLGSGASLRDVSLVCTTEPTDMETLVNGVSATSGSARLDRVTISGMSAGVGVSSGVAATLDNCSITAYSTALSVGGSAVVRSCDLVVVLQSDNSGTSFGAVEMSGTTLLVQGSRIVQPGVIDAGGGSYEGNASGTALALHATAGTTTLRDLTAKRSQDNAGATLSADGGAITGRDVNGVYVGSVTTESTAAMVLTSPLGTASGGLGLNAGSWVADRFPYTSSTGTFASGTITSFARGLLDDTSASNARSTLGVVIGTDVQAYEAFPRAWDHWIKRAEFWDDFSTNSTNIESRTSPSGHAWGIITGGATKVEVASGYMQTKTANLGSTTYPCVTLTNDIRNLGAEMVWEDLSGTADDAGAVLIIAQTTDLPSSPFLHCTMSSTGWFGLDWYASGLTGGVTANVNTFATARRVTPGLTYRVQVTVEPDASGTYTVTFITPSTEPLRLTGLNLPSMKVGIWEFVTSAAPGAKIVPKYKSTWANARSPQMLGLTTQPASPRLTELSKDMSVHTLYNFDGGVGSSWSIAGDNTTIFNIGTHVNGMRLRSNYTGFPNLDIGGVDWYGGWQMSNIKVGGLAGGNGTVVTLIASATATLNFPSIAANGGTQDLTVSVANAVVGSAVQLGLPAAPSAGVSWNAWVSATGTVTIRATNCTTSAIDPASASYRVAVMGF